MGQAMGRLRVSPSPQLHTGGDGCSAPHVQGTGMRAGPFRSWGLDLPLVKQSWHSSVL